MLKKEFWDTRVKKTNKIINKVMITLGGSDDRNQIPKILSILKENFPNYKKNVVIGM